MRMRTHIRHQDACTSSGSENLTPPDWTSPRPQPRPAVEGGVRLRSPRCVRGLLPDVDRIRGMDTALFSRLSRHPPGFRTLCQALLRHSRSSHRLCT
jgi:hypothetical protein